MPTRMEELEAKGMGAVKAVKATVEGLHGVFKKLMEEHGEVSAMLLRVRASKDVEVRRELWPTIRAELLAHCKGEVKNVYAEFEKRPELQPMAKDHDAEARQLEQMLGQLDGMDIASDAWKESFDKLVDFVTHHVEEEESDYFPAGERVLGKEEAERLQGLYEATKAEELRQPS